MVHAHVAELTWCVGHGAGDASSLMRIKIPFRAKPPPSPPPQNSSIPVVGALLAVIVILLSTWFVVRRKQTGRSNRAAPIPAPNPAPAVPMFTAAPPTSLPAAVAPPPTPVALAPASAAPEPVTPETPPAPAVLASEQIERTASEGRKHLDAFAAKRQMFVSAPPRVNGAATTKPPSDRGVHGKLAALKAKEDAAKEPTVKKTWKVGPGGGGYKKTSVITGGTGAPAAKRSLADLP